MYSTIRVHCCALGEAVKIPRILKGYISPVTLLLSLRLPPPSGCVSIAGMWPGSW